jgi:hypothetical protein
MNYQELEIESVNGNEKHIIIDNGDESYKSFPADPENPEYVKFLETLEATEPEAE